MTADPVTPVPPKVEPEWQRRLACCGSEPPCLLCPMLPANATRSLKELAMEGLRANLREAGVDRPV
jgi:hypothetical protein